MITVFIRVRRAILRLERNKLFSLAAEQVALGRPSRSASRMYSLARARLTEKPSAGVLRVMTTPPSRYNGINLYLRRR